MAQRDTVADWKDRVAYWRDRAEQAEREREIAEGSNVRLMREAREAEAQLAAAPALVEALRRMTDCKGPYNGTVSERGGYPATCHECLERARDALAAWEQAQR